MDKKYATRTAINIVEEIFNSITHGLGMAGAITGLVLGIIILALPVPLKVGFIIYAASLIL